MNEVRRKKFVFTSILKNVFIIHIKLIIPTLFVFCLTTWYMNIHVILNNSKIACISLGDISRLQFQSEVQAVKMFFAQQSVHRYEREVPEKWAMGRKAFHLL